MILVVFFFQAEDGIRDYKVTGVQTCALPIYRAKVQAPLLVVELLEGHRLAAKDFADEDQFALPFDVASLSHRPHLERVWVFDRSDSLGILPSVPFHAGGRSLLAEGLMRTDVVELRAESVEATLLRSHVRFRRLDRMLFERPVHPLVNAVLLRPARLNAGLLDAELDPHLRELGQPAQRARRTEGIAVVGDDLLGESPLSEHPLEDPHRRCHSRRLESLD